ncbi:pentatricopeptide repeat-containing protein [Cucumis melo var. makuwa]|uniref:Pentatricopeptide repeat-containing protein n=1 Tax=Cucumis melo var. makuwa TaxID=1194695 RepID=A0A5A7V204_CUCMM|nr:pentatricopeptide repeat-containing protein [Cucumis melo var. makuwa]TYK09863.1 pentatricopeptide repeat-containing protein [Cucumis melo var. makuwa]
MIEANGVIQEFLAGDKTHPNMDAIEDMLVEMAMKLKLKGYTPDTNEVLLDVDEEEKESILFRHSEKLAISSIFDCFSVWAAINVGDQVDSILKDMAIVMKQLDCSNEAIEAIKSFSLDDLFLS